MRSISNLFAAFANLAASINALAGVVDVASGRLRQQLALDAEPDTPALPHAGEVLDNDNVASQCRDEAMSQHVVA